MQSEGSRLFPLHLRTVVLLLLVFRPVSFPPLEPHTQSSHESFRQAVWLDPGPKEKNAGHDIKTKVNGDKSCLRFRPLINNRVGCREKWPLNQIQVSLCNFRSGHILTSDADVDCSQSLIFP